jgi:hypothetical protein
MKDFPNPGWAAVFICLASGLAALCLFTHAKDNVVMAVITMASSIITGAFGYIQGVQSGKASLQVPLDPPAATQVTVNPTQETK